MTGEEALMINLKGEIDGTESCRGCEVNVAILVMERIEIEKV